MCCEGKCFGIVNVEVGSLVFGVFSAVLWALSILVCVIMLVLVNVFNDSLGIIDYHHITFEVFNAIVGSLLAVGLLNFFFAVLLCDGINKRNTAHIRAYFIYGIVTTILASMAVFLLSVISGVVLIILGMPIVIYCFILHMINLTIAKFNGGQIHGFSHKLLVQSESLQIA